MKKLIPILLSVLLILSFASCKRADTEKWQSNDTFSDVQIYQYGDTIFAEFASEANIKIKDNNYDHFVKYINDLKEAGFHYLKNGDIPENYNLNNGTASWRCTNDKVYLQLIFSEDGTNGYNMFGCNIQIYGYSTKPESWGSDEEVIEVDPTDKETKPSGKETKPDGKETKPAVKETKPAVKETKPAVKETKPDVKETKPDSSTKSDKAETTAAVSE